MVRVEFVLIVSILTFVLHSVNNKPMQKLERSIFLSVGSLCIFLAFVLCRVFIRMKLPYVLIVVWWLLTVF